MNKDLEEIKAKIEYAKAQTEQLKLLVFIIFTVGTGIFSLIFMLYGKGDFILKSLLTLGVTFVVPLIARAYLIDRKLRALSKKIEEELKQ